jgi:hypothetical protein
MLLVLVAMEDVEVLPVEVALEVVEDALVFVEDVLTIEDVLVVVALVVEVLDVDVAALTESEKVPVLPLLSASPE